MVQKSVAVRRLGLCLVSFGVVFAMAGCRHQASLPESPLMLAIRSRNASEVQRLLKEGADPNGVVTISSPLDIAADCKSVEMTKILLAAGADPNGTRKGEEDTPIARAAGSGSIEVMQTLLDAHADINRPSRDNLPIIAFAINRPVAEFLVSKGAVLNPPPIKGWSLLERHLMGGHDDVVTYLVEKGVRPGPKEHVVAFSVGRVPLMDMFVKLGCSVNQKYPAVRLTDGYMYPLHAAAIHNDPPSISFLLSHGADPRQRDSNGLTPLMQASRYHLDLALKALLEKDHDVDAQDEKGRTALHFAVERQKIEGLALGKNKRYERREWPAKDTLSLLLAAKANVNVQDKNGWSPLFRAATLGESDLVQVLLAAGSDSKLKDKEGKTALDRSREFSDTEQVQKLLQGVK